MRVRLGVLGAAALLAVAVGVVPARSAGPPKQLVLSPEGNHLWAYDAATGAAQLVVQAQNGDDPGEGVEPNSAQRRDINGQICVAPNGQHVVTGEDTVFGDGTSHGPRVAGWGWFHPRFDAKTGRLALVQQGKLSPEVGGPGYRGDPDNYGCGFLDNGRLFTTAIGDRFPGQPANGQLFLWFVSDPAAPTLETTGNASYLVGDVAHCEIAGDLATAGGIAVDGNGDVYVATNRPDDAGNPGGVWRFSGDWPTNARECEGFEATRELVIPGHGLPVVPDARVVTPSSVAISAGGTLYVASVFTGTVSEYDKDGTWIRDVYPTAPIAPMTGPTGNTPYGLAFTARGDLWLADLGIVGGEPGPGLGSVQRVRFDAAGNPIVPADTIAEGLQFPDGLGVYTVRS